MSLDKVVNILFIIWVIAVILTVFGILNLNPLYLIIPYALYNLLLLITIIIITYIIHKSFNNEEFNN